MRLIDADALLYDLEIVPLTGDGGVDANDLDDIIKRQPTIETQHWIPCKESLPPSGTACFVTVECSGEKSTCISTFDHGTGWSNLEYGERVVSWMPLPEPYGGEQDGSD